MNVTLAPRLLRLQQSLHGRGSQHGSNLNVRLEYIWVKKMTGRKAKDPPGKNNFMAKHDRNIYNKWYQYNEQNFCCSSTELQPNLQVSAVAMPTLFGEVSSIQGRLNILAINKLTFLQLAYSVTTSMPLPSMLRKMRLAFYFMAGMMAMEGSFRKHSTWITHLE